MHLYQVTNFFFYGFMDWHTRVRTIYESQRADIRRFLIRPHSTLLFPVYIPKFCDSRNVRYSDELSNYSVR